VFPQLRKCKSIAFAQLQFISIEVPSCTSLLYRG